MEVVSFKIAQKLREKGYPQDTEKHNAWYATEYYKNSCLGEYFEGELTNTDEYGDKINALHIVETENKGVVAPTISQVLKWLREEKKIEVVVLGQDYIGGPYFADVFTEDGLMNKAEPYPKYEQAALAGIVYVLDNLI